MVIRNPDGTVYDDTEGVVRQFEFECRINPDNYQKLTAIAHKNGLMTLDVSTVINYVIQNFNQK